MRISIYFLVLIVLASCGRHHHNHLINQPVNVGLNQGKWLIDEPLLERVDLKFESKTIDYYREILKDKFSDVKYISEFNHFSTLKKALVRDKKALKLYKSRINCDYLISTKLEMVPSNYPSVRNFSVTIIVYDLNTENIIFKNEYHSYRKIKSATSSKLQNFIDSSIKIAITDFSKKENWKFYTTVK